MSDSILAKEKKIKDTGWRLSKDGRIYKKGTKRYPNKDVYEGEFIDGLRHGKGTLTLSNGDKYVGEFENNLFHGFGELTWATFDQDGKFISGKKYEGQFMAGKRHGKGVYILGTGETYSGNFANNLYNGQGSLKKANKDIFVGEFARGLPCGQQHVTFSDGGVYAGEMSSGKFNGQGRFVWPRGLGSYDGEWSVGSPHGRGVRVFSNGNKFVGMFVAGEIQGEGLMMYANGDQYIGDWVRGMFDGTGTLVYRHGDRYEGSFRRGCRYGRGRYSWSDGGWYEGEYAATRPAPAPAPGPGPVPRDGRKVEGAKEFPAPDGLRHGFGVRVWASGARYEGEWRGDHMEGEGVLRRADGGEYRGQFRGGERCGLGSEQLGNRRGIPFTCLLGGEHRGDRFCEYTGEWAGGVPHGRGELRCCDGRWFQGQWRRGKRHGQGVMHFERSSEDCREKERRVSVRRLYRPVQYEGVWTDDTRCGHGILRYRNGDEVEGEFLDGFLHGLAVHRFRGGLRGLQYAMYDRGQRLHWRQPPEGSTRSVCSLLTVLKETLRNYDAGNQRTAVNNWVKDEDEDGSDNDEGACADDDDVSRLHDDGEYL